MSKRNYTVVIHHRHCTAIRTFKRNTY